VLSIVCALAYTGGPYPLGYNGLGDVFVFLFFGLVAVTVTFFVQTGRMPGVDVWLVGAALGVLAANILVANNYRDVATDAKAGKRTLVVRFGRRFARWQYGLSSGAALAVPVLLVMRGGGWTLLAPLVLAPWAWSLSRRLRDAVSPLEQIAVLADTAKLLAAYGVLLSAGLVFAGRS
jgi:1,4-dihydroxy-2-naphthoate octaprenyltransferase